MVLFITFNFLIKIFIRTTQHVYFINILFIVSANGNADKAEMITVPESIGNMCSKALILSDFEETALQDSGSSGNQTKCINTVTVEKCEGSTFDTASITSLGASIFAQPSIQISKVICFLMTELVWLI